MAAGPGPTPAQSGEGPSPVLWCSIQRPTTHHTDGLQVPRGQAWQTKTVSAFRSKKSPVPLLAPTYSFTGRDWWTPLMRTWDKMKDLEKFKDLDYIIPTLSKDSTGIIPRPSAADRALRWPKAALHRNWSTGHPAQTHLAQLQSVCPRLCLPVGVPQGPASIPGKLDHGNHGRHLYPRQTECGRESLEGSGG